MKRIIPAVLVALVLMFVLFDVDVNPRFQLPGSEERLDPEQESRYEACVEQREGEIHAETFARVDNPDVQRELLYRRMQEAKAQCREKIPERRVLVEVPLDINVVDLDWRY